jgi:hypothetical protein
MTDGEDGRFFHLSPSIHAALDATVGKGVTISVCGITDKATTVLDKQSAYFRVKHVFRRFAHIGFGLDHWNLS